MSEPSSSRLDLRGQPVVDAPPCLRELIESLELAIALMVDFGLLPGAAWDSARAACWSHWKREASE